MALVLLLRGVNVGGHKTFRPKALADRLRHRGAVNIGAAGTFVVREKVARTELREEVARSLPFDAEIMICEGRDILSLIADDPFEGRPVRPDIVRFVSVLARTPRSSPDLPLVLPAEGEWMLRVAGRRGPIVFGEYRRHMKAIQHLGTLDRLFGVPVTTRNWNTIVEIGRVLNLRPT